MLYGKMEFNSAAVVLISGKEKLGGLWYMVQWNRSTKISGDGLD